jgi:hypothetical protein
VLPRPIESALPVFFDGLDTPKKTDKKRLKNNVKKFENFSPKNSKGGLSLPRLHSIITIIEGNTSTIWPFIGPCPAYEGLLFFKVYSKQFTVYSLRLMFACPQFAMANLQQNSCETASGSPLPPIP